MSAPAPHVAEVTRPAETAHLPALLACLDETAAAAGVPEDALFALHLAAEEALANVVAHGYPSPSFPDAPGPVSLRVQIGPATAVVTITDRARPFDPAIVPAPPLDAPAEDRPVGGLGWHLVRQSVSEVRHQALPDGNRLTLTLRLSP